MDELTPVEYHAAMFRRLGRGVKLSRSGFSVVFDPPVLGRSDLSGIPAAAEAQLRAAGIDPNSATAEDVAAYTTWRDGLHRARRIGGARIQITAMHGDDTGREKVPAHSVRLVDGWGVIVASHVCQRVGSRWDAEAINNLGQPGAFVTGFPQAAVDEAIGLLRTRFPEYADAPVQDNSGEWSMPCDDVLDNAPGGPSQVYGGWIWKHSRSKRPPVQD